MLESFQVVVVDDVSTTRQSVARLLGDLSWLVPTLVDIRGSGRFGDVHCATRLTQAEISSLSSARFSSDKLTLAGLEGLREVHALLGLLEDCRQPLLMFLDVDYSRCKREVIDELSRHYDGLSGDWKLSRPGDLVSRAACVLLARSRPSRADPVRVVVVTSPSPPDGIYRVVKQNPAVLALGTWRGSKRNKQGVLACGISRAWSLVFGN